MKLERHILDDSLICRKSDQIYSKIDNEIVMLSISHGEYYNLNPTGSIIWNLLNNPTSLTEIIHFLREHYNIPYDICYSETKEFIEELHLKGLIEFVNEDGKETL